MSRRVVKSLAVAIAWTSMLVLSPVAIALPDLDDVEDKVDEVKEDVEDKVDDVKDEVEEQAEEVQDRVEGTVDAVTDGSGGGDGTGGDGSSGSSSSPGAAQVQGPGPSADSGGDEGGGSEPERSSRRENERGRSSPAAPPPPPALGAVGAGPGGLPLAAAPPIITRASRAQRVALLGPSGTGPLESVPPGELAEPPSRAQSERLRRQLDAVEGCLGDGLQAKALRLRAGGRSWAAVGQRLGVSSRRALSLGRFGLNRMNALAGGCGAGANRGVSVGTDFSRRYGVEAIGSEPMLGMGGPSDAVDQRAAAGLSFDESGAAPQESPERGDNSVLDRQRAPLAPPADGQSPYVGSAPPAPGVPLAAAEDTGNGQGAEVLQALALLALALLLVLTVRYRLRYVEPATLAPSRQSARRRHAVANGNGHPGPEPPGGRPGSPVPHQDNGHDRHETPAEPPEPREPEPDLATAVITVPAATTPTTPEGDVGRGNDSEAPRDEDSPAASPTEPPAVTSGAHPSAPDPSSPLPVGPDPSGAGPVEGNGRGRGPAAWHERPRARRLKRLLGGGRGPDGPPGSA